MSERIPTPLAAKRLVYKAEELCRKREGTWDATTMVSVTSPEGAALLALQRASPEKVAVAQPIAIEPLKNETPPHEPTSLPTPLTTTVENGTTKTGLLPPAKAAMSEAEGPKTETTPLGATDIKLKLRRRPTVQPEWLSLQETAIYCGYTERTIFRFVKRGIAPRAFYLVAMLEALSTATLTLGARLAARVPIAQRRARHWAR